MRKLFFVYLLIMEFVMASSLSSVKVGNTSIPFIFEKSDSLPIVSMELVFVSSGAITDGNLSGLAKFSASLLNEGSLKSGSEKFAERLDSKAIHLSSGVGYETFVIRLDSLKENFLEGVELLIELLTSPNLSKETFEMVQAKTISKILQTESNYDYQALKNLKKLIFKGTPLASTELGTVESVQNITLKDVEKFLKNRLVLKRVIPIIGGNLSEDEAKKILKSILGNLEVGESQPLQKFEFNSEDREVVEFKDTKQAYIYFASPLNIKYSDKDRYKAKVMFFILGSSGFGSRLMEEVRVKNGLAYSVSANGVIEKSRSYFSGHLQTKIDNLDKAKDIVERVIKEFIENGATEEELESAKKFILGSEPLRNETLSQRLHRAFKNYYSERPLDYNKKELELIKNLSLSELNQFIKKHREILQLSYSIITLKSELK